MRRVRLGLVGFAAILVPLGTGVNVHAGQAIGVLEAGLLLANTIPDIDFDNLTRIYGFTSGVTLAFSGEVTTTGFLESLGGTYQGQAVTISYVGNSTAYATKSMITWSASGSYGSADWSSSGAATFSLPTATTFNIQYTSSLSVGSNTAGDDLSITGDNSNATSLTYTGTTGTITINGASTKAPAKYNSIMIPRTPKLGDSLTSDIQDSKGNTRIVDRDIITKVVQPPKGEYDFTSQISSVPEPSSLVLQALGTLSVFGYCWCRGLTGHRRASRAAAW
jgi:hypothetical protein